MRRLRISHQQNWRRTETQLQQIAPAPRLYLEHEFALAFETRQQRRPRVKEPPPGHVVAHLFVEHGTTDPLVCLDGGEEPAILQLPQDRIRNDLDRTLDQDAVVRRALSVTLSELAFHYCSIG